MAAAEAEDALMETARAALGARRIVRITTHCPPVSPLKQPLTR